MAQRKEKANDFKLDSGNQRIQKKMMSQMVEIDKEGAERILASWKQWSQHSLTFKGARFESMEEYMEFRVIDCAAM